MGLIHEQHGAGRGQLRRQPRPAEQLHGQFQGQGLLPPEAVQTHRGHHGNAAVGATGEGAGCHQGCEGLAQAHRMGQDSPTASQQPAGRRALVAEQLPPVRQGGLQLGRRHQLTMRRQGGQWLAQPGHPLGQVGLDRKARPQQSLQLACGLERKLPAMALGPPAARRPDPAQLGLGDRIERGDHLDQAAGPKLQQAARLSPSRGSQGHRRASIMELKSSQLGAVNKPWRSA